VLGRKAVQQPLCGSVPIIKRRFRENLLEETLMHATGTTSRICLGTLLALAVMAQAGPARGPLRVHPENPRYFTDGTKGPDGSWRAVYLTGAHTWNNLVDMGRSDPPEEFDYAAYLNFLDRHHHNFIRLWAWDSTTWDSRANRELGKDFIHHCAPLPWARTGPGLALDGKPRFDLTKYEPAYFERLRSRVTAAGERGIYVGVMFFEGWGLMHGNRRKGTEDGWAWRSHPFNPANNINGLQIAGADALSGRVHTLGNPEANKLQAAYIRQVVDTLNDLDNVLYEVANEGGDKEWNWWVVRTVQDYQRTRPKQHPVGITGHGGERVATMLQSPADWLSPGSQDGYRDPAPAWDQKKVSLLDTDHIWGVGGTHGWVWRSFLRGHNPIFMDPYDGTILGEPRGESDAQRRAAPRPPSNRGQDTRDTDKARMASPQFEPLRRALGHTRRYADRMNLAAMTPRSELASTEFCLANPGREYLVYLPHPVAPPPSRVIESQPRAAGPQVTVDLSEATGPLHVEWMHPVEGTTHPGPEVTGGAKRTFTAPFPGDAVLYLRGEEGKKVRTTEGRTAGTPDGRRDLLPSSLPTLLPSSEISRWPTATPESQGMSRAKLEAIKDSLAARKTKAFLVIRNDKIVYEWYASDHGPAAKHYTASMAKAIGGGVAFGVAVTDGLIALDDRAAKYVPQWRDDPRKSKITLRQLGSHTSGVEDAEADGLPHDKLPGWKGDFWKQPPVPRDPFTVSRDAAPILFEPGTKNAYSNPGIAMLTYCTTAALREAPVQDIRTLLRDRVMRPLGVPDSDWSAGYNKTFVVDSLPLVGSWGGGSYTARATARVGQLMLHEGNWQGRQLLSKEAVRQITRDAGTPGSGAVGWWSNNEGACARLPRDAFWGAGAGHQIVLVVPSRNLVAVRNGAVLNRAGDDTSDFDKPVHRFLFEPLMEAIN